jgi:hypothetical protein
MIYRPACGNGQHCAKAALCALRAPLRNFLLIFRKGFASFPADIKGAG